MKVIYQKYPVSLIFGALLLVVMFRRLMVADPEKVVIISVLLVMFLGYELFKANIALDLDETSEKIKKEFVVYLDLKRQLISKLKANYASIVTLNKEISFVFNLYLADSYSIQKQTKNLINIYTNILINNLVKEQWDLVKLQNNTVYTKLFNGSELNEKLSKAALPNNYYITSISNNTIPYNYKNKDWTLFYLDNLNYDLSKSKINWVGSPYSYLVNFIYKANSTINKTVITKVYTKKDSDLRS